MIHRHVGKQICEVKGFAIAFGGMVAIHVLPDESDLFVSARFEFCHFSEDGLRRAATFPPAGKGNNAEAAHIVAPAHDGDES